MQPDVALLAFRADFYDGKFPLAEDCILLVEVSDTTLAADRRVRLPLYARSGVPDVWIVNLQEDVVEVYSQPLGDGYQQVEHITPGSTLQVPGISGGNLSVDAIPG